jgi:predicted DNA-binding transcriptional regulator AlpA
LERQQMIIDRFVTWKDISDRIPLSLRQIDRLEASGEFPIRRQVGPRRVAWLESEVVAWAKTRFPSYVALFSQDAQKSANAPEKLAAENAQKQIAEMALEISDLRNKLALERARSVLAWDIDSASIEAVRAAAFPVKQVTGIYFLFDDDELVYIGQSSNIMQRVGAHLYEAVKGFNKVAYIAIERARLDEIEAAMIRKFRPPYNDLYPETLQRAGAIARQREQESIKSLKREVTASA